MIISFSGTSASGKSTIIAEIFKSNAFKGTKLIVRKEDDFLIIRLLKILLGENIFSKYKEEKFFRRRYNNIFLRLFSILSYIFYPIIVYAEFLAEYIGYELLFRNKILIGDRFTYDYVVTFKNVLGISNRFIDWLYYHSPKPYLAFLVDINLATALKRNKNNIPGKITAEESLHKNVLAHYREIARLHKLIVVDNNNQLKSAVEKIKNYIVNKERFEKERRIVICGLDGTGKTTIATMLAQYIKSLGTKSTVIHFYHENLLYKLLRRIGFYRSNFSQDIIYRKRRERSAKERVRKTSFVLAFLRFFDSYIQYLFALIIHRDKVIIFDRFFYDYLVSFKYLNIRGQSFFKVLLPKAKNTILLESRPETSYKRKPESVREFYEESYEIYLKVAKQYNIKVISTDSKTPEVVLQEVINNIN